MKKLLFLTVLLSTVNALVAGHVGGGGGGGGVGGCKLIKKGLYHLLVPSATASSDSRNGSGADTSDFSTVLRELDKLSNFSK